MLLKRGVVTLSTTGKRTAQEMETEMSKKTTLLSCPFCGLDEAFLTDTMPAGAYWIECAHCGAETQGSERQSEAIAAWNRRAPGAEAEAVWDTLIEAITSDLPPPPTPKGRLDE